MILLTILGQ